MAKKDEKELKSFSGGGNARRITEKDMEQPPTEPGKAEVTQDKNPRKIIVKVQVQHANMDPKNREVPIQVNDLGSRSGKKTFMPGQTVDLSQVQLGILKNSVEYHSIDLPEDSGIYQEHNPLQAARQQYPGFDVQWDKSGQNLLIQKTIPNYYITQVY